ncbi:hypothetical protein [Magnetovibrio sp.]|uniref:hypothetical protein n=1 Tax=Magnetovibrio sp. TaxID=2024836 RepID=UPI002F95D2E5
MTQEPSWVGKYIGLPFVEKGRDFDGVDCYGLYWLIRSEEYGETLPMFLENFSPEDVAYIRGLIAGRLDAWRKLDKPEIGCGVLLKVQGQDSHIGVMIGPDTFIHVNDDANQVHKDRIGGLMWPQRKVVGYYAWPGGAS